MSLPDIKDIYLYRITHIDNISHIVGNGVTHRCSNRRNANYVGIGDVSLISYRSSKLVITKRGNEITLGDYMPFYFGVRMPMLYVIQNGFNQAQLIEPKNIVYVVVGLSSIVGSGEFEYYYSDGHATNKLSMVYGKEDIMDLPSNVDWMAIKAKYWCGDNVDVDVKRRREAEFLIKGDIGVEHIKGYICYNREAADKLIAWGVPENKIAIRPLAYF